jgi:hypothetical protein
MPAAHDWVEVEDKPFPRSKVPVSLPAKRQVLAKDGVYETPLDAMTKAWWKTLSAMPHCVLWSASDWQFALVTALVADAAFRGIPGAAAELRQRERVLGTTHDARRDLRIRYVEPVKPPTAAQRKREEAAVAASPSVSRLDDRRRRVLADDAD